MASQTDTPPGFERAYARESHELLLERLRVTLTVGAVLYSAFWLLDLFVVPDQAARFLVIRLTVVALGLLIIWSTYTKWGQKLLLPLSVFMMVFASVGISAMTMYLGGFSSNYYIGNLMVLFVIGFYMPWSLRVTVWFCVLLWGGFFAPNLAAHGPSLEMGSATGDRRR